MKKTFLVTGGAGFVGSHLCLYLKNKNHEVYSLDNYFTGKSSNHIDGVNYIEGETKDIKKLVNISPDVVFHLGEYSRVEQSFEDIDLVWKYNRFPITNIIEFCLENNSKLVYSGSSTKFGDGGKGKNMSPYAFSKSSNTELIKNYGEWYGLNFAISYFYNVYGPKEISNGKYATLIAKYRERMLNNLTLEIVMPGDQERNFTHIDDIINGLYFIQKYGEGDDYGIGSDRAYSVKEVADLFGGKVEYLPERKGNRMSAPIITKKLKDLGWKPKKSLDQYITLLKENNWNEL